MATYSMEDIELIRRKSGITYEEAVSMLDYHNGDVARVLIDLEKNGRLHEVNTTRTQAPQADSNKKGGKFMNFIQKMIRTRIKVRKGDTLIINLSVLFVVAAALLMGLHRAFGIAAIGLILGLMMGYQINIDNNDEAFTQEKVEKIVRNAADNVKKTVNGISREINTAVEKKKAEEVAKAAAAPKAPAAETVKAETVKAETVKAEPVKDMNAEILQEMDRQLNGPAVPTIQVPLRSESTDGSVEVTEDGNGYHTATIG